MTTYTLQADHGSRSDDRHDVPQGPGISCSLPALLVVGIIVVIILRVFGRKR